MRNQAAGRGLDADLVHMQNRLRKLAGFLLSSEPVFMLEPTVARTLQQNDADRLEAEGVAFQGVFYRL